MPEAVPRLPRGVSAAGVCVGRGPSCQGLRPCPSFPSEKLGPSSEVLCARLSARGRKRGSVVVTWRGPSGPCCRSVEAALEGSFSSEPWRGAEGAEPGWPGQGPGRTINSPCGKAAVRNAGPACVCQCVHRGHRENHWRWKGSISLPILLLIHVRKHHVYVVLKYLQGW